MTSAELERLLLELAARVQAVEDELAITRLLTSYGFAVDGDDAEGCADLYAADAVFELDGAVALAGREELRTIVTCDAHQAILPGCAHVMGPFTVDVTGDLATATGYATVYVADAGKRKIWRQSLGRWELARRGGRWLVTRRSSWAVGRPEGQQAARAALAAHLTTSAPDDPT